MFLTTRRALVILVALILVVIIAVWGFFELPALDFVMGCLYSDGTIIYAHRVLCPPHIAGVVLVDWDVGFSKGFKGESMWDAYFSPLSGDSPYGESCCEPMFLKLLRQLVYSIEEGTFP